MVARTVFSQIVGLGHEPERRGGLGVADADHAELYPEETGVLIGAGVQPVQHCPVLWAERCGDPDHGGRMGSGCIGQQLAEVGVIGGLQLVSTMTTSPVLSSVPIRSSLKPPTGCSATSRTSSMPSRSPSTSALCRSQGVKCCASCSPDVGGIDGDEPAKLHPFRQAQQGHRHQQGRPWSNPATEPARGGLKSVTQAGCRQPPPRAGLSPPRPRTRPAMRWSRRQRRRCRAPPGSSSRPGGFR